MTGGPINPDPEQQRADNLASARQSHIGPGPLPPKPGDETEERSDGTERGASREGAESAKRTGASPEPGADESATREQSGTD